MDPTFKGLSAPLPSTRPTRRAPQLKLILLIAGGFLLIVTVLGLIFSRGGTDKYLSQRLVYRIERVQALTNSAENASNNEIRKIASEVRIVLSGHATTLKPLLPSAKTDKQLAAIKTAEQDETGQKALSDAKLNGVFDSTYKRLFSEKIQETYALAGEIHDKTPNKSLKTALANLRNDLQAYYTQLQAIQL